MKNTAAIAKKRLIKVLHEDRIQAGLGHLLVPGVTMIIWHKWGPKK